MEQRPIDANALKDYANLALKLNAKLAELDPDVGELLNAILNGLIKQIDAMPTLDVVPVIRCKDCKHRGTNGYRLDCAIFCCTMPDDAFCSCGERRENG